MKVQFQETAKCDSNCEIELGIASWDNGNNQSKSVKYAWKTTNGTVARGGEVPVEALPQMLDFAIRNNYIHIF